MLSFHVFANQNPLPRFTVHTRAAVSPFARPPISVSPLFATHTSRSQTTENSSALSPLLATHTDFVPVTPVFATHTKTTGVYTNNSHSGTGEGGSCRPDPKVCFESGLTLRKGTTCSTIRRKQKNYDWSINRWWMTYSASSRRSDTPSLSKILWRWFLTVCSEMKSFSPISLLRNPWATSCTISFSRSLSRGFSRRGPDSADFENAFMTSAVMRLSSQISPACTR